MVKLNIKFRLFLFGVRWERGDSRCDFLVLTDNTSAFPYFSSVIHKTFFIVIFSVGVCIQHLKWEVIKCLRDPSHD